MENLAKALAAFQKELPKVGKDKTANIGTYSYKYTDLGTLTHTVIPLLNKHGLTFITAGHQTENGYELRGILLHVSGESIEGALPIFGRQPQEIGSSISYNRRYLLSAMTGVVTEDDDDGKAAVKATRTKAEPAKDWQPVMDTAAGMSTVDGLRDLWTREGIGKAPKSVQDTIKQMVADAQAREGDEPA